MMMRLGMMMLITRIRRIDDRKTVASRDRRNPLMEATLNLPLAWPAADDGSKPTDIPNED